MRLRTITIAAALSAALSAAIGTTSFAFVRSKTGEAPYVAAGRAPRLARDIAFAKSAQLAPRGLPGYEAILDRDTDVPLRLWGHGILASGSVTDAAIAERAARQFLAEHIATLAPGAAVADFELVSNQLGGIAKDTRSVGFQQRAHGLRVLGGELSFAFKHDRLALISSTALPNVAVTPSAARVAHTTLAAAAAQWLGSAGHAVTIDAPVASLAGAAPEHVIVPTVRPRIAGIPDITYQVAEAFTARETGGPNVWTVWVDATTGAPIARQSRLAFATGTVNFNVPVRRPNSTRMDYPAPFATHTIDGTPVTSTATGGVTWSGAAAGSVALTAVGPQIRVVNTTGTIASTMALAPGGTIVWNQSAVEAGDSQLTSFIHAGIVRNFALSKLNPTNAWLLAQIEVDVNVAPNQQTGSCNAFWDGEKLNLFPSSPNQCQATGRLADVIYHEFGHGLHQNSFFGSPDAIDGALGEGMADTLSTLITRDSDVGLGFLNDGQPLRQMNPPGVEKKWPDDIQQDIHATGEIIGEALWDTQAALIAKLGEAAGYQKSLEIYYGALQRASDIPSTYAEALLADDDDGDLANGTPNQCEINAQFAKHGLYSAGLVFESSKPTRDGFKISLTPPGSSSCGGPTVASAAVEWKPRGGTAATVAMTGTGALTGVIPTQPDGSVVQYRVVITLSDGSSVSLPNNPADKFYEFYVGPVDELYCASFETGLESWTHGGAGDEWQAGAPMGLGGDPVAAYDGSNVLGMDLSTDGIYSDGRTTFAESPAIDLQGRAGVRLQYWRWLGVEDGVFDMATTKVNGQQVWSNFASPVAPQSGDLEINHLDREWRFQDVDLAGQAAAGSVKVRFELTADQGLGFAGWNVDKVCVVAAKGAALTCGNGAVDAGETCDDGNRVDGDGCSVNCALEDTGSGGGGGTDDTSGCCSANPGAASGSLLGVLTLGLVGLRRRRRR